MKRILTSALVLALITGTAQAQSASEKSKGHNKEHRMGGHDKMGAYEQLNLTAEQKAQLLALKENFKRESESLRNNNSLSAEEKQARRKELHANWRSQSAAILTPAQQEQLQKIKAEKRANKEGKWNKGDKSVMSKKSDYKKKF